MISCRRLRMNKLSAGNPGLVRWIDRETPFVARRYDRLAALIPLFDWLFFFPPHLRDVAAARLDVEPGARVLEIGCGTGRNFPALQRAVGRSGRRTSRWNNSCSAAGMCAGEANLCTP